MNKADFRAEWGCDAPTKHPQKDKHGKVIKLPNGEDLHDCPNRLLQGMDGIHEVMNYFNAIYSSHGTLPHAGGFYDQPATFCEAMILITSTTNKIANERFEREREKLDR